MTYRGPGSVASEELAQISILGQPPGDSEDLIPLITSVGKARFVLLSEAPHGTHEYYEWRGHRAIVVVCHPERERAGNCVPT